MQRCRASKDDHQFRRNRLKTRGNHSRAGRKSRFGKEVNPTEKTRRQWERVQESGASMLIEEVFRLHFTSTSRFKKERLEEKHVSIRNGE